MSLISCPFLQPWDGTSTPAQPLQAVSMDTSERNEESSPYGIDVSFLGFPCLAPVAIHCHFPSVIKNCWNSWRHERQSYLRAMSRKVAHFVFFHFQTWSDTNWRSNLHVHRRPFPRYAGTTGGVCLTCYLPSQCFIFTIPSIPCGLDEWCRGTMQTSQLYCPCKHFISRQDL